MEFKIKGRVTETESEQGVRDLLVRAWDKDRCYDDLLGNATTDAEGRFEIVYTTKAFRELFDELDPEGSLLGVVPLDLVRNLLGSHRALDDCLTPSLGIPTGPQHSHTSCS